MGRGSIKKSIKSLPHIPRALLHTHGLKVVRLALEHISSPAPRLIKAAHERFLSDIESGRWLFVPQAAQIVADFFDHLIQSKGVWAGRPVELLPYQAFVILNLFGFYTKDNLGYRRRFREVLLSIPRKNGKSSFTAGIGLYCLLEEAKAEVYCAAQSRDQASILFDYAADYAVVSPDLKPLFTTARGVNSRRITYQSGYMVPIHAESRTLDGLSPSCIIYDEFFTTKTADLYTVLRTPLLVRRSPILFLTGSHSDYLEGFGYLYEQSVKDGLRGQGALPDHLFALIYEPDHGSDLSDPKVWRQVNPGLGTIIDIDTFKADHDQAKTSEDQWVGFAAKNLNVWPVKRTQKSWLKTDTLDKVKRVKEITAGQQVVVAFDLSFRHDLTAACIVGIETGEMAWLFWIPADTLEERTRLESSQWPTWIKKRYALTTAGAYVDIAQVYRDLKRYTDRIGPILFLVYDRYRAEDLTQMAKEEGIETVDFPQHRRYISPAVRAFEAAVYTQEVSFVSNPLADLCLTNANVDTDQIGNHQIVKPSRRSRIDGAIVAVMAWYQRKRYLINGALFDPVV